jgi:hypothetical protein
VLTQEFDPEPQQELTVYAAEVLGSLLDLFENKDGKTRHYALFIFTREEESKVIDPNFDRVSVNVVSSIDPEFLHEYVRGWLKKETQ